MTSPTINKRTGSAGALKSSDDNLLQQHVRELYIQQIMPALQEVLHEQGKQKTAIPDDLTMDMDKLAQASSRQELKHLLRQELFSDNTAENKAHRPGLQRNQHTPDELALLAEFLQKGIIPPSFPPTRAFNFMRTLEVCYQQNSAQTLHILRQSLSIPAARHRFLNLCNTKECLSWVCRLAEHLQLTALNLLQEWSSLLQQHIFSTAITRSLQEKLLQDLVSAKPATSAMQLLARQFLLLRNKEAKKAGLLANHLIKLNPEISLPDRTLLIGSANPLVPVPSVLLSAPQEDVTEINVEPEESCIQITNAGLVLLHAFLTPYLQKATGLSKQEMQLPANRVRAAQLLHFLCTGQSGTPEHQMFFNKILCGVPLYQPIPARLIITAKIRKNAHEVLQAIITHWSILKCNSIAQLRDLYLQRNGLLERNASGWTLRFEKNVSGWLPEQVLLGVQKITTPIGQQQINVEW